MKLLLIILALLGNLGGFENNSSTWLTDYEDALAQAKADNKSVLISFAGSDWCRPCIMLTKEVFEDPKFEAYAEENLVLLLLDFPRLKKNKLSPEQTAHNEKLAAKFNTTGEFPLVVLLDPDEKVLAKTGYQKGGVDNFINYLKSVK